MIFTEHFYDFLKYYNLKQTQKIASTLFSEKFIVQFTKMTLILIRKQDLFQVCQPLYRGALRFWDNQRITRLIEPKYIIDTYLESL